MSSRPVGTSARAQDAEVLVDPFGSDVLGHPDRADRVEALVAELAVVLQPDLHFVADAGLADPLPGQFGLLPADRDADCLHSIARRRVDGHRSPSATDIEQPHALALVEAQLAGDEVVLGRLGVVERHAVVDEAGAGVRHRIAEDEPVEVVADVVVVADRPRVAAQRVAATLQPRLLRWRRQRPPEHSGALRRGDRFDHCSAPEAQVLGRGVAERLDHGDEIALGVEVAGDVRPTEAELVGHPQQSADGVGRVDPQRPW